MPTTFGFIGGSDTSGQWYSSSINFVGPATKFTFLPGLFNFWVGANGIFDGSKLQSAPVLTGGYKGLTFMKNVFVLTRDYWDTSLSNPYVGQVFPHAGNAGSPGQVFPY